MRLNKCPDEDLNVSAAEDKVQSDVIGASAAEAMCDASPNDT